MSDEDGTITVTLRREDAIAVAYGPFDYACAVSEQEAPAGGSPKRLRRALAVALGLTVKPDG